MRLYLIITLSLITAYGIKTLISNHLMIESNLACLEVYEKSLVIDDYLGDLIAQVDYLPKWQNK